MDICKPIVLFAKFVLLPLHEFILDKIVDKISVHSCKFAQFVLFKRQCNVIHDLNYNLRSNFEFMFFCFALHVAENFNNNYVNFDN